MRPAEVGDECEKSAKKRSRHRTPHIFSVELDTSLKRVLKNENEATHLYWIARTPWLSNLQLHWHNNITRINSDIDIRN